MPAASLTYARSVNPAAGITSSGYNEAMRKCLLAIFVSLLALSTGVALAERVQDLPKPTNYVSDFAGVLSPETVTSLNRLCAQVDRQAHAQIAVVTIKSLDGEPIENFATALEDKWKVGKKGTDRGLLLIFATSDRKYRIEVGYGLEGILPDGRVGDIGRQLCPICNKTTTTPPLPWQSSRLPA